MELSFFAPWPGVSFHRKLLQVLGAADLSALTSVGSTFFGITSEFGSVDFVGTGFDLPDNDGPTGGAFTTSC